MRVAFDTNVLVSAFATRGLCADLLQVVLARHQLLLGETVLREFRRALVSKLRVEAALVREVESHLRAQAEVIRDAAPVAVGIRDTADRTVVAEAVAGKADVLVTGDRGLLAMAAKLPVPLVAPRTFWEMLKAEAEGA